MTAMGMNQIAPRTVPGRTNGAVTGMVPKYIDMTFASNQTSIVPLLPTFHGMESENPYSHIKEFEEAKEYPNLADLQAEFLKKFFPTHRTNGLKRQISYFSAKENEKFYECWEGDFMSKNPEEAMDFLSYVAEVSRGWDEPNAREVGRMKSQPNAKGGMYVLNEDIDMKVKVAAMARRLEELEMKKHLVEECPTIPAVREMFGDQANVIGQFKPNNNASYGNTYNSNWRNHPNFSWKPKPPQYTQPAQAPQQALNLNKLL
ncbi:hypothetical protein CK203_096523 [Vitis vinifera]|uniref:Retrotransposon gag domain-containing protein n=1 Tax=Vitis vinifera TaxID=29760 RepID=A0A438CTZ9_VITVI|nr:hypothetical protein CK203_096523 [Vitis vinifera]